MPSPDFRLRDIAQSIMDVTVAGLTAHGIDVPTRRYIHSGQIAHDFAGEKCAEAFIVAFGGLLQGAPGQGSTTSIAGIPIKCAVPLIAQFNVVLLRCVPTLIDTMNGTTPPTVANLQLSGEQVLTDAMTLPAVMIDESLVDGLTGLSCELVGLGNVDAVGPAGGIGGVGVTLFVSLI